MQHANLRFRCSVPVAPRLAHTHAALRALYSARGLDKVDQNYGMDHTRQGTISFEDRDRYARALLTIAAADGLSDNERDYFVNLSRAMEMPDEVAEKYATYDTKSSTREALVAPPRGKQPAPYLIYDAIKVASVDGYTTAEQAKVEDAARALGVPLEHVRALEGLVAAENATRQARLAVLAAIEKLAPS